MITRDIVPLLKQRLAHFPAVAILGPRQSGKTTLAKQLGGTYFDLEQTGSVLRLDARWDALVADEDLLVLDEAQEAPEFFPRLRGAIDADRQRTGRFLLLGSVSPTLMRGVSESLAGRLALVELSPFLLSEVGEERLDDLWLFGGYPDGGIRDSAIYGPWQESYLALLMQRDLPAWGLPAKPRTTDRLVRMLAAMQGQTMNAARLGSALGLDSKTVAGYCDYLEGAYLIRRLQPFHSNIRKRLVKSPKVYWRDSGLLHHLLGTRTLDELFAQPWVGHSWEGFLVEQTISSLASAGSTARPFFFRTSDGYELDLVLEWGGERWAVEFKLTSSPTVDMVDRLSKTADMIDASRHILVCRTTDEVDTGRLLVTNAGCWLRQLAGRH
ncbi:MAG: ATP-binding protein [Lentisphaerae bacterium]|jgi:uncharacterized protein|nr:ATP-binding protein [Lentisphaerota bacterium]MBT4819896.1 ATP-binding protein [Lentisphaerota bacterium]MBT5608183.1 ATP-binding protein [Lentisphaerota bacterium]MBT7058928.1 ATP-binding protein [Lentisphaerota bacterium]MBT7842841.1 ATP-binding protein [Lentisphaerota bacterium]